MHIQAKTSMTLSAVPTITESTATNAFTGKVSWSPKQSIWMSSMFLIALIGAPLTFSWQSLAVFIISSAITLCFGHSLGMHRRLIHNSYKCSKPLEYFFVHLGVLIGLAGPFSMIETHDMRDWAQRQKRCHDYFAHRRSIFQDGLWQLHCKIVLEHPPQFTLPKLIANDPVYRWMEKYWMWQQLPWALLLGYFGGIDWIVWGIAVRVSVCCMGHWLVGYFAHRGGERHWHVDGAAVQGYDIKAASLFTFGECWHNNHHAFPESAKLGLYSGQYDPGWWALLLLKKCKLVWDIRLPEHLPPRAELIRIS